MGKWSAVVVISRVVEQQDGNATRNSGRNSSNGNHERKEAAPLYIVNKIKVGEREKHGIEVSWKNQMMKRTRCTRASTRKSY